VKSRVSVIEARLRPRLERHEALAPNGAHPPSRNIGRIRERGTPTRPRLEHP
jgi:hypothetical protein